MRPASMKKPPVGSRRSSMSGEPEVQDQKQNSDRYGDRARPQIPAYSLIVFDLGEAVYQPLQLALGPWPGRHADEDRYQEAGGPGKNGDPEVLGHGRWKGRHGA